jgi:hypothetical protein
VLGIEAVGVVERAPGNEFQTGDIVATAMGGKTARHRLHDRHGRQQMVVR